MYLFNYKKYLFNYKSLFLGCSWLNLCIYAIKPLKLSIFQYFYHAFLAGSAFDFQVPHPIAKIYPNIQKFTEIFCKFLTNSLFFILPLPPSASSRQLNALNSVTQFSFFPKTLLKIFIGCAWVRMGALGALNADPD